MRSSSQPHDLCLLSPAISAYSAVRYVPDSRMRSTVSRLISDHQPLDQHLPTALSAPFSRLISACQPLDQRLSAARSTSVNDFISTSQLIDQRLSAALSSPNQLRDQRLLNRFITTWEPLYQHLSATISATVNCLISDHFAARSDPTQPRDQCPLS